MVAASFFSLVVLAASALAIPSRGERFASRLERRGLRQGKPSDRLPGLTNLAANGTSHVQYSSNWAGAVYDNKPAGTFKSVTATFTVPKPTGSGSASAWVGIDGDTCGTAILQTGLDFTISSGRVSYDAWYEWFPDYAYDFSGISFSSGDSVTITVTATTKTSGSAVIKNNTTGKSVSKTITSSAALCEQNAEWIVEDYESGGGLVPFANFGTVTFTGASAGLVSGGSTSASGASLIDIQQSGKVLTSSSISGSSVTVRHT